MCSGNSYLLQIWEFAITNRNPHRKKTITLKGTSTRKMGQQNQQLTCETTLITILKIGKENLTGPELEPRPLDYRTSALAPELSSN
jgi:hypothetical protein